MSLYTLDCIAMAVGGFVALTVMGCTIIDERARIVSALSYPFRKD